MSTTKVRDAQGTEVGGYEAEEVRPFRSAFLGVTGEVTIEQLPAGVRQLMESLPQKRALSSGGRLTVNHAN